MQDGGSAYRRKVGLYVRLQLYSSAHPLELNSWFVFLSFATAAAAAVAVAVAAATATTTPE